MYFYFKLIDNEENFKNLALFSLFSAIATSTRIFGIIIPITFIFIYFLTIISQKKDFKKIKYIIFYLLFYFIFLYIHWPYLWDKPITNFLNYIFNLNIFGPELVYFFGEFYNTKLVPYYYLPVWLIISTPVLNLVLFILGFYSTSKIYFLKLLQVGKVKVKYDFWKNSNEKKDFLILVMFIIFFLAAVFLSPKQYNGWRIFYFFNFFIIYYSVFFLFKMKNYKKYFVSIFVIIFFFISINIYKLFLYHPYQSYYFNELVSKKFKNKFEVDYAGLSGISFLRHVIKEDKSSNIKIAVNSWYPLWRMKELLPSEDQKRIEFVFQDKNKASYIYSNKIFDVDVRKSKKYNLNPSYKIYKRYIVNDLIIYEVYKKE